MTSKRKWVWPVEPASMSHWTLIWPPEPSGMMALLALALPATKLMVEEAGGVEAAAAVGRHAADELIPETVFART